MYCERLVAGSLSDPPHELRGAVTITGSHPKVERCRARFGILGDAWYRWAIIRTRLVILSLTGSTKIIRYFEKDRQRHHAWYEPYSRWFWINLCQKKIPASGAIDDLSHPRIYYRMLVAIDQKQTAIRAFGILKNPEVSRATLPSILSSFLTA